ncbi:MAG TPA: hypothetical protein PLY24_07710, partial [Methanomassiliicoccales archaeon]|nr:hypothetical protein [Methanomassiliicoccales archaeon]
ADDELFVERPRKKAERRPEPVRQEPREVRQEREGLRLFGQDERELYDTIYPPKEKGRKEPTDELQGRRCLFHGALAVSACPNCNSMLCKECQAGGRCPRCGLVLGERARREEGPPAPVEPEERDWSRL